jgi:D-glycero-D-manno-heptose 1,7-bisphosphate phosphatase
MINFKKVTLVILAGGRGSRIKNVTKKIPKPLIKFNKIPLLTLILNNISKYNFKKVFILAGFKGNQIFKKYNNKYFNFNKVECVIEKRRLGTFGAILNIKKKLTKNFIVVNGDTIFDANLIKLKNSDLNKGIVMFLTKKHSYKENKKLNNLITDRNGYIYYNKKSHFINSGTYLFSKKILNKNFQNKSSLENDVIPQLIKQKKITGYIENNELIDIGTPKNLDYAKKNLKILLKKPAVFFDRDGVINYDYGYVHKYNDFRFRPFVIKALKFLSQKNIYIFIVTNQAGIAKGYYKKKNFYKLHKRIKNYLANKKIYINDVKFSPYHPDGIIKKYTKESNYRKPGNLMIKELFQEWNILKNKSFMIGDQLSDKKTANISNIYFEYVKPNIYKQVKKICRNLKI